MKAILKILHKISLNRVKTIASIVILLATSIFLTKTLINYYGQIQNIIYSISPIRVIISLCFFICYLYLRALSWGHLIHFLGTSINRTNSLSAWFLSEATRYIPGSVWSFVTRSYLAQQKNISRNISILISPVESIIVITATTILSLYAIFNSLKGFEINTTFYILVILSLVLTFGLLLLHKPLTKIIKKLATQTLAPKALATALIYQFLAWSFYALGYIYLIDITNIDFFLFFSSALLAWLIGYLSIITPMGLGVRESAFVLLTGPQIGTTEAALIAILARVILIIAELSNLVFWISKRRKNISV